MRTMQHSRSPPVAGSWTIEGPRLPMAPAGAVILALSIALWDGILDLIRWLAT